MNNYCFNNQYLNNNHKDNNKANCDYNNMQSKYSCINSQNYTNANNISEPKRFYSNQYSLNKCKQGPMGPQCPRGFNGPPGPQGEQGPPGSISNYADFYALMPPDNSSTIAPETNVDFHQDGPNNSATISRTSNDSFSLSEIGTYLIMFQVSVTEAGQLVLTLNDEKLPYTVVGRGTDTSQIVGMSTISTSVATSILTVRNPSSEPAALTITPNADGPEPVSAHLVIIQLQ